MFMGVFGGVVLVVVVCWPAALSSTMGVRACMVHPAAYTATILYELQHY